MMMHEHDGGGTDGKEVAGGGAVYTRRQYTGQTNIIIPTPSKINYSQPQEVVAERCCCWQSGMRQRPWRVYMDREGAAAAAVGEEEAAAGFPIMMFGG